MKKGLFNRQYELLKKLEIESRELVAVRRVLFVQKRIGLVSPDLCTKALRLNYRTAFLAACLEGVVCRSLDR